jgi:hypothetical protein
MPVVVFRAIEGWCDRLQVLSHFFQYCVEFNTALCVDWSDYIWAGNREFDFYDCFYVEGIKTVKKDWVCVLTKNSKLKITPPCWDAHKIWDPLTPETGSEEYECLPEKYGKIEGDVIVSNGRGHRRWSGPAIANHLRFKPKLLNAIQERLKDFDPNSCVVHLRGTDRPDSKGNYMEKSIEKLKDTTYQVYVVTDQWDLWEKFKQGVPHAKLVNPDTVIMKITPPENMGSHQLTPPELKALGITKWQYMVDLLTDWVALVTAKQGCGRFESTFFFMARLMNKQGEDQWSKMFGGWKPHSKSLQQYNETLLLSHREQAEIQQGTCVSVPTAQDIC